MTVAVGLQAGILFKWFLVRSHTNQLKSSQATEEAHIRLNVLQGRHKLLFKYHFYVFRADIHVGENGFSRTNFFDCFQTVQFSTLIEVVFLRKGIPKVTAVCLEDFLLVDKTRPRIDGGIVDNTHLIFGAGRRRASRFSSRSTPGVVVWELLRESQGRSR